MKLITIEEHNAEVRHRLRNKMLTGIEYPTCKNELQYKDNTIMLSSPPQKDVICFNCGYMARVFVD
jgi:hypothetical protein